MPVLLDEALVTLGATVNRLAAAVNFTRKGGVVPP